MAIYLNDQMYAVCTFVLRHVCLSQNIGLPYKSNHLMYIYIPYIPLSNIHVVTVV